MGGKNVIVVGGGLAGLTSAIELVDHGYHVTVLEAQDIVGGRTSSWIEDGMAVESGFHRFIGYYKELPAVLAKIGIDVNHIVKWEEQIDIRTPHKEKFAIFGVAPIYGPIKMIKGLLGNNQMFSIKDKILLLRFFVDGFKDYLTEPENLDKLSILEYAEKHGLDDNVIKVVITPFSSGLFFLPPDRYSAYTFFGLLAPAIPRFYSMRIGAFLGGMTDIMAQPMADYIEKKGGKVLTGTPVEELLVEEGSKVMGVKTVEEYLYAEHIILATSLVPAQQLLNKHFQQNKDLEIMLKLPSMPAVTVQIDLDQPALDYDRTTFGPGTSLASFAEESRTTFKEVPGRLSIILTPAEKFIDMASYDILQTVINDAKSLGVDIEEHIKDYRVISHPADFYSLEPGHDWMRPNQKTSIKGLTLAGDYTQQPYFATMEGAVVSGQKAAQAILTENNL